MTTKFLTDKQKAARRMANCVDRVMQAKNRKQYELARRDYRKALHEYEKLTGLNMRHSFDPQPWSDRKR